MVDINYSDVVEWQTQPRNIWLIVIIKECHLQMKITHVTNQAKYVTTGNKLSRVNAGGEEMRRK